MLFVVLEQPVVPLLEVYQILRQQSPHFKQQVSIALALRSLEMSVMISSLSCVGKLCLVESPRGRRTSETEVRGNATQSFHKAVFVVESVHFLGALAAHVQCDCKTTETHSGATQLRNISQQQLGQTQNNSKLVASMPNEKSKFERERSECKYSVPLFNFFSPNPCKHSQVRPMATKFATGLISN